MSTLLTMHRRALLKSAALSAVAGLTGRAAAATPLASSEIPSTPATPALPTPPSIEADLPAVERTLGLSFTDVERKQLAHGYDDVLQTLAGLRKITFPNDLPPAVRFDPRLPGKTYAMPTPGARGAAPQAGALPGSPVEIALSPAWKQAAWLRARAISSVELTRLYLERIGRIAPRLENFITVTEELALAQAARADEDLARGRVRSALHGVPYGLKDLFDVTQVRTTWGAEPYKDRVAATNATIVDKLEQAGTVLLGKTAVGALAYGDVWHGGISRNPWNLDEGSSGSSAGSASATAAGLVGFSIGTETLGSIVSPSHRCGVTGLRPTFGRVSRHGAMAAAWSWDKVGPIARTVSDCALALEIINGGDMRDWGSIDAPFGWDWQANAQVLRVGYAPEWFEGENATDVDRRALEAVRATGAKLVEVSVPKLPYSMLYQLVIIEAAAAFAELTFSNRDDELKRQDDMAWPNSIRRAHLFPAVEMVQLERVRCQVMVAFDRLFSSVDAIIGPSFAADMLTATNASGHPCLALKAGFIDSPTRTMTNEPLDPKGPRHRVPCTISLWAGLFREDVLVTLGRAIEQVLAVTQEHPPIARS
jgi:Asp-tRNA(Asn)/Glu-tRNA(Gln) amidotransferase A subunit family amidase